MGKILKNLVVSLVLNVRTSLVVRAWIGNRWYDLCPSYRVRYCKQQSKPQVQVKSYRVTWVYMCKDYLKVNKLTEVGSNLYCLSN